MRARQPCLRLALSLSLIASTAASLGSCGAGPERRTPSAAELAVGSGEGLGPWEAEVESRRTASAPGVELERLSALVGEWRVALESTGVSGPAGPVARGRARVTPELGGRFLRFDVALEVGRQRVESRGLLGYDGELEQYELLWYGELSSAQRIARGRGDAERGGIRFEATVPDPETGALRHTRSVLVIEDPDRFTLEQWGLEPETSEWLRLLRTTYVRATSSPGGAALSPGESSVAPGPR